MDRRYDRVNKAVEDLEVLNEFHDAGDASDDELEIEYKKTAQAVEELEFKKMLSHEEDQLSAMIEINPGAGGTESQDWAEMLQPHVHHVGREERLQSNSSRLPGR